MRLVADESGDLAVVVRLREDGHEVLAVSESTPGVPDDVVLSLAAGSLLLTADKDFGDLIFRQRLAHSGVLLIRLAGLSASEKANLASRAIQDHGAEIALGFAVLSSRSLRIRRASVV